MTKQNYEKMIEAHSWVLFNGLKIQCINQPNELSTHSCTK